MRPIMLSAVLLALTSCGSSSDCSSWFATYELTGSVLEIDAQLDFTITVETPYDAADTMGPGVVVVRFADDGGAPGAGGAQIVSYTMAQDFVTGAEGVATVHTELDNEAATAECGNATGSFDGTTAAWDGDALNNYCQTGQVSCTGSLCGQYGSPPEGEPLVFDNECSSHALSDFEFNADLTGFTMEATVVNSNDLQTTTLALVGTQVSLEEDNRTPDCACN